MAHAPILQQERIARRAVKAQNIITQQEVIPCDDLPGWFQVRDSVSGSGSWHLATISRCDCYDAGKGNVCKHQLAVRAEETALAQYCADWNTRSERARAAVVDVDEFPGSFLDSIDTLAFDEDGGLMPPAPRRGVWYKGFYHSPEHLDQAAQARAASPVCPDCGAELDTRQYYVGGKGYVFVKVCTRDQAHKALPA